MTITYIAAGGRVQGSAVTSRSPTLPSPRSNGDLLIAIAATKNNDTHSISGTGWTKWTQVNSGASWTVSLSTCIVNGSEAQPTISWTNSAAAFAQIIQYRGTSSSPFGASGSNTGTGTTHSKTGITTTANNSMVIYIDVTAVNTALATPSGWTENLDNGQATSNTRNTNGNKTIATSGTGSGDISVTGGNADWVMWQIELLVGGISAPVAQASESDAALAFSKGKSIGQAAESDAALAFSIARGKTIGQASETGEALALTVARRYGLGIASEIDEALALQQALIIQLGIASEIDSALEIVAGKLSDVFPVKRRDLAMRAPARRMTTAAKDRETSVIVR